MQWPRLPRSRRGPTARRRRRMSWLRRARRSCCRWSPAWCRPAAPRSWRRPMASMPAPPRSPDIRSMRCATSTHSAAASSSSSPIPTIPTAARSTEELWAPSPRGCARAAACWWSTRRIMDVGPPGASLAPDVARGNIVVLRSFGKFFGLAGLRLGFALADAGDGGAACCGTGALGGFRPGACGRREGAGRQGVDRADASPRCAARRSDSMPFWLAPVSRSSAARRCSGWCARLRRAIVPSSRPRRHFGSAVCRGSDLAALRSATP